MIIHDVEQRSAEWYALRLGVPTASDFSKAITPKQGKRSAQAGAYAAKLALEIYNNEPCEDFIDTEWMERGAGLEAEAISQYEMIYDVDVTPVGFITDDKGRGCSPDGLVGSEGSVEIKCLKPVNHVAAMVEYDATGEFDAKYIPQTQGQMLIAQRAWCDLILYAPGLPILIIRQTPDEVYQKNLDDALSAIIETRDRALTLLRGERAKDIAA